MGTVARAAPRAHGTETLTGNPEPGPTAPTSGLRAAGVGQASPVIDYDP